jgi:hypothetical protein
MTTPRLVATRISRCVAERLAVAPRTATVVSVYRRVANLRLDSGELVAVGAREVPLAANGVAVELAPEVALDALGLRAGRTATLTPGALRVCGADVEVDLSAAVRWEPRPAMPRVSPQAIAARALEARVIAVAEGESGALLPLLWRRDAEWHARDLVGSAVRPAAALRDAAVAGDLAGVARAGRGLAGLGPGLTPSGDDYLAGFAAAWALASESLGREAGHTTAVLEALSAGAEAGASDLGRAWLAHAARGEVAEPMGSFFAALAGRARGDLAAAVRGVLVLGATSGTDWMTGALAGVDATLAAAGSRAWS